jgi:hypothetical protein
MDDCQFENKVQTLKVELMAGQTNQAANLLRDELYCHPQEAMSLINRASLPNTPDQIMFGAGGTVSIHDNYTGYDVPVGRLPCEQPQIAPPGYAQGGYGPGPYAGPYERVQPCAPQPHCEPIIPAPYGRGNVYEWGRPHREEINIRLGGSVHFDVGNIYENHRRR